LVSWATRSQQRPYELGQRVTKRRVLVGVKMHAVHHAGASHLCGVKERTLLLGRDLLVGLSKTDASLFSPLELRGDQPLRPLDRRRCHDKDLRDWHVRFNRGAPNGADYRCQALRRVPCVVLMHVTCPPDPPGYCASPARAAYSVGVRFPSALWGRTSL